MSNVMPSDVKINHYEMAKIMAGHNDEFYTNILKGVSTKYFNAYGENFKIETLISDFEWKLLNETKMIGNLKCFKAISSYKVSNALIERVVKVEAWYSPKIQFSFGPKGYCGLPGLIIELKDDKFTYIVKDIKVIKEEFEFKKRPDGKLVTQEEIDALSEKAKKNYLDRKN
jgi:GLPGLI family protein